MSEPYTIIRRFLFELVGTISLDRNDQIVLNFSFVLSASHLNILAHNYLLLFITEHYLSIRSFLFSLFENFQLKRYKRKIGDKRIIIHSLLYHVNG